MGLGTQDSLSEAEEFVAVHRIESFPMLWDESFESWVALGVASQPAAILFAADGTLLQSWRGVFDEAEVLALAAASA
jgi:hypothetical protein